MSYIFITANTVEELKGDSISVKNKIFIIANIRSVGDDNDDIM